MRVKETMTPQAITVEVGTSIQEAALLMRAAHIGMLPVVLAGTPVGVLTDRDIVLRAVAEGRDPKHTPVRFVMTQRVYMVREDEELEEAVRLMKRHQVGRVVVCDLNGKVSGILSEHDYAVLCNGDSRAGDLAQTIAKRSHRRLALVETPHTPVVGV